MDSLYTRLAREWDNLFQPDIERLAFLDRMARSRQIEARITEVGCGSGATAVGLAELGHAVAASDLDEDMIMVAAESAGGLLERTDHPGCHPRPGRVSFSVADMVAALESGDRDAADLVLCLGNTLPHLIDVEQVDRFFDAVSTHTAPGGQLIIQILNYERIRRLKHLSLPELGTGDLVFRRRQRFDEGTGTVEFTTEVEAGGRSETRTHTMNPLMVDDLNTRAQRRGLWPVARFGDWSEAPADHDTPWFALIFSSDGG